MPTDRPVIAHVLHRLDRAGAEVLAAGLSRALRDRFDFVFFCLDGLGPLADELSADGFVVEELGRKPGVDLALGKRVRLRLIAHNAALVHAHQYTPFFYSALSRGRLGRRKHPPILFTEHGRHYPDTRSTRRVLANKLLLSGRDRVTAVGAFVREALVRNEGLAERRVDVIYNGIAPGDEPTDDDRRRARAELGIEDDRPVAMQIARFHPVKDHGTALGAWAKVHEQLPDALLVLVGDGGDRQAMQSRADEMGLKDAVRFTGPVPDARRLIPAADLCLLTSLSEGVSVTLLEAMAAGRAVVATSVGGNPEVVEDGVTGLLAPRGDGDGLAQHLLDLFNNTDRSAAMGKAGRERLLDRFTADRMHAAYAREYTAMLGG
jgi:glycosyltransferase involved in cell wall biosynthesis